MGECWPLLGLVIASACALAAVDVVAATQFLLHRQPCCRCTTWHTPQPSNNMMKHSVHLLCTFACFPCAVLWAVAGVVFNHYESLPQMAKVPLYAWRHSIPILSFVACGLFAVMCLAAIYSIFLACCCGGFRRGYKSRGTTPGG